MLKELLFNVISVNADDTTIVAIVAIDINNEILKGHFPDHPVVPGASMLQLVKEVLATAVNKPVRLTTVDNIKFLSLLEPSVKTLQLNIAYQLIDNDIKATANLTAGEVVCMKLQGIFTLL